MSTARLLWRLQRDFGWGLHLVVFVLICHFCIKHNFFINDQAASVTDIELPNEEEVAKAVQIAQVEFELDDFSSNSKSHQRRRRKRKSSNDIDQDEEEGMEDSSKLPNIPDEEIETNMKNRVNYLQQQCSRLQLGLWKNESVQNLNSYDQEAVSSYPKLPSYQSLLVKEHLPLSYCPLVGAGDKWMSRKMLQLINVPIQEIKRNYDDMKSFSRSKFPYLSSWSKYLDLTSSAMNVIVIRSPFDRIISAFEELFVNADYTSSIFKQYSSFILKMYRSSESNIETRDFLSSITFSEFCQFLIYQNALPELDAWKPLSKQCSPCSISFSGILKYETLIQEMSWILRNKLKLEFKKAKLIKYWITPEIREKYFSSLTEEQIDKLYLKYKLDFDLFNFEVEPFKIYTRKNNSLDDKKETSLNDKKETSLDDKMETSLNDKKETSLNDKKETSLNDKKETSLDDKKETSLNDKKETSLNDKKETSLDDKKETSLDDKKETSLNDKKETSLDDKKETSLDDKKETSLNDEKETSLDDTKKYSPGGEKETFLNNKKEAKPILQKQEENKISTEQVKLNIKKRELEEDDEYDDEYDDEETDDDEEEYDDDEEEIEDDGSDKSKDAYDEDYYTNYDN